MFLPFHAGRFRGPWYLHAVGAALHARESILDVFAQPIVDGQLCGPGTLRHQFGLPLRDGRAVLELSAPSGRDAAKFTRDRRRITPQFASDRPHTEVLRPQQRDLFPLNDRYLPDGGVRVIDGMPPRSRNHRKPPGPDTPQDLGLDSNDKVWALERLRFMDDQPLALMHNVPASVVDVGSIDLETAGLYNALRLAGVQMLVAIS